MIRQFLDFLVRWCYNWHNWKTRVGSNILFLFFFVSGKTVISHDMKSRHQWALLPLFCPLRRQLLFQDGLVFSNHQHCSAPPCSRSLTQHPHPRGAVGVPEKVRVHLEGFQDHRRLFQSRWVNKKSQVINHIEIYDANSFFLQFQAWLACPRPWPARPRSWTSPATTSPSSARTSSPASASPTSRGSRPPSAASSRSRTGLSTGSRTSWSWISPRTRCQR